MSGMVVFRLNVDGKSTKIAIRADSIVAVIDRGIGKCDVIYEICGEFRTIQVAESAKIVSLEVNKLVLSR